MFLCKISFLHKNINVANFVLRGYFLLTVDFCSLFPCFLLLCCFFETKISLKSLKMEDSSRTWIDICRIISIFGVVLLHTSATVVINKDIGSFEWWIGNIYDSSVRWCVPMFVMISGALLLSPEKTKNKTLFYKKRIYRIIPALVFWSFVFILWDIIISHINGHYINLNQIFKIIKTSTPHYHLWFLYMIPMLYLITPFLANMMKKVSPKHTTLSLTILFVISIMSYFTKRENTLFVFSFIPYISYFICGKYISEKNNEDYKIIAFIIFFSMIISTAILTYFLCKIRGIGQGLYFYDYISVTVIPMSISLFIIIKNFKFKLKSIVSKISSLSFGVYLVHPIILELGALLSIKPENYPSTISIPIIAIIVLAVSLTISYIFKKIKILNILV